MARPASLDAESESDILPFALDEGSPGGNPMSAGYSPSAFASSSLDVYWKLQLIPNVPKCPGGDDIPNALVRCRPWRG